MTRPRQPCLPGALALLAALALLSCGGGSPSPSSPAATPVPAASATPGTGVGASCRLGAGSTAAACQRSASRLADYVLAAMDELVRERPQLFDPNDEAAPAGSGNYRVLDKEAYLDGLVAKLQAAGLCAQRDPDDASYEQLQVKSENGFSESFDVLLGAGYVWHNGASYRATCVPASFPVERSAELPPLGSGCGRPYPPPVHDFGVKVHVHNVEFDLLDSTPLVGPDAAFCAAVGYTDGRLFCPVRGEGSVERVPCENWRVGNARDTGRPGPTWTRDGRYCTGPSSGCENAENQYQLLVYASGVYQACAENGACGRLTVTR